MILAELTAHLHRHLQAAVANGDLPASAATLTAHGTWHPPARQNSPAREHPPARANPRAGDIPPGTYTSSLPFQLARLTGELPVTAATRLAAALHGLSWIDSAHAANGYLTITITPACLAGLPARIVAAGSAVARGDALAGRRLTAPGLPDLARAPDWPQAWRAQHRALLGRLAGAAGADVQFFVDERMPATSSGLWASKRTPGSAMTYFGADAVRYALARVPVPVNTAIEEELERPLDVSSPFVLVRHAHASAASTRRWAAELELTPSPPAKTGYLLQPELRLIDRLSWLPERVAAASRRSRPAELTAYLEAAAAAWIDCAQRFPALPFGGRAAPDDPAGAVTGARLELSDAAKTVLAAGLDLLAVAAPARI